MSCPEAPGYIDILSPPVLEVLGSIGCNPVVGVTPLDRSEALRTRILEAVGALNWSSFDLPDVELSVHREEAGDRFIPPAKYGAGLIQPIFRDCKWLLDHCEQAAITNDMALDSGFSRALQNSRSLLQFSSLSETDKTQLSSGLTYRHVMKAYLGFTIEGNPVVLETGDDERQSFDFDPQVKTWISERAGEGCPAAHVVVTNRDNKKQVLTKYFWDKLVEVMYV